jgi:hypothetical protein
MKVLAWYSGIVMAFLNIYMLADMLEGNDISGNVWGMAFYIPVLVFVVLYLKGKKGV